MVNDVEFGYGHNAIITSLGWFERRPGFANQRGHPDRRGRRHLKHQGCAASNLPGAVLQPYGSGQTIWDIAPYGNHEDLYTVQDNLTYVRGNHTFKVGAFYSTNAKIENNNGGTDTPHDQRCVAAARPSYHGTTNQLRRTCCFAGVRAQLADIRQTLHS